MLSYFYNLHKHSTGSRVFGAQVRKILEAPNYGKIVENLFFSLVQYFFRATNSSKIDQINIEKKNNGLYNG